MGMMLQVAVIGYWQHPDAYPREKQLPSFIPLSRQRCQ
jgi:hypothetical protein